LIGILAADEFKKFLLFRFCCGFMDVTLK
jgi:hypothetical protein